MWIATGLITMTILGAIAIGVACKHGKFRYVVYASAAFLPTLLVVGALVGQASALPGTPLGEVHMFGADEQFFRTIGFSGSSFLIDSVPSFVWYGQVVFALGALVFFWCIMSMLLALLIGLNGGSVEETADLFKPAGRSNND